MFRIGTNPDEILKIYLQHGSDRQELMFKREYRVADLQNEISRLFFIPIENQRIFYRSHELGATPNRTLKEYDMENNALIRVTGAAVHNKYVHYLSNAN